LSGAGDQVSLVEPVRKIKAAAEHTGDLADSITALRDIAGKLAASDDALVKRFRELVSAEASGVTEGDAARRLPELARRLGELRTLGDQINKRLTSKAFDADAFHEDPEFKELAAAQPERKAFSDWLGRAQQEKYNTPTGADPRDAWLPRAREALAAAERSLTD